MSDKLRKAFPIDGMVFNCAGREWTASLNNISPGSSAEDMHNVFATVSFRRFRP
jgi:hypothetical protein